LVLEWACWEASDISSRILQDEFSVVSRSVVKDLNAYQDVIGPFRAEEEPTITQRLEALGFRVVTSVAAPDAAK
jgi:hypothetical protein